MAQAYELTGVVRKIFDTQTFPSGFTKREFVVESGGGNYPQMVKFETVKDKITILDGVNVGDEVIVTFDIRGNEFKERYYVNLSAWKLRPSEGGEKATAEPASFLDEDDADEMPF